MSRPRRTLKSTTKVMENQHDTDNKEMENSQLTKKRKRKRSARYKSSQSNNNDQLQLPETNYSHLTTFQANGQANGSSKTKKKIINYDASGKRTHTCDRCGKSFNNGHALGGHKKYCGKAEFTGRKKKSSRKNSWRKSKGSRTGSNNNNNDGYNSSSNPTSPNTTNNYYQHNQQHQHNQHNQHDQHDQHDQHQHQQLQPPQVHDELSGLKSTLRQWVQQTVLLEQSEESLILQLEQELKTNTRNNDLMHLNKIRALLSHEKGRLTTELVKTDANASAEDVEQVADASMNTVFTILNAHDAQELARILRSTTPSSTSSSSSFTNSNDNHSTHSNHSDHTSSKTNDTQDISLTIDSNVEDGDKRYAPIQYGRLDSLDNERETEQLFTDESRTENFSSMGKESSNQQKTRLATTMTMMMMASSGHNKNEDESCSDVHSNTHVPNVPQQPGQKNTIPQQKQTAVLQVPSEMLNTKPPSEFLSSSSSSSSSSSINGAVSDMFWIQKQGDHLRDSGPGLASPLVWNNEHPPRASPIIEVSSSNGMISMRLSSNETVGNGPTDIRRPSLFVPVHSSAGGVDVSVGIGKAGIGKEEEEETQLTPMQGPLQNNLKVSPLKVETFQIPSSSSSSSSSDSTSYSPSNGKKSILVLDPRQ